MPDARPQPIFAQEPAYCRGATYASAARIEEHRKIAAVQRWQQKTIESPRSVGVEKSFHRDPFAASRTTGIRRAFGDIENQRFLTRLRDTLFVPFRDVIVFGECRIESGTEKHAQCARDQNEEEPSHVALKCLSVMATGRPESPHLLAPFNHTLLGKYRAVRVR
ncbi:MAG: hypothetical protein ACXU80_12495 [Xanthobacteraceae bacterium]